MAKALVEVVGDSASAVRALEQTSAALSETGDAAKNAAVDMDAYAASAARAGATRAETLLGQSAALKQFSAANAGTTEGAVAQEAALKRQTQAYKLLGVQAATTGESLTKTAGTIGRGLTTYATVPAAFIGYEAVKQALDFNQSLLLIRTQAGASQQELEHMNTAVLQLVQSGKSYGQTAQQMAQGLFYVESEGIRGGRALATIQAAAAGAAKGQTDMADTTNALTSAMKIWKVSADGAATTMATIDAITATGKMHLQDLNEAFNTRYFSTVQSLGVPLEQAGALLDVFTKMGVPASSAATNLTTSFIRMVDPAKAAGSALQSLGLTTSQLGRDLQTGGITKALGDLTAGYEHLRDTQGPAAAEQAVFAAFGGSKGGGTALQAIKGYQSYLESLGQIQRLNNPATFWSQVAETMHQPAMQIKQDVAEIGADFIKLGTALAPTVATLAGGVAKISSAFSKLPGPIKDSIGVVVGVLAIGGPIGLAVSGIGHLITGLRTAFQSIGPAAVEGSAGADAGLMTLDTALAQTTGEVGTLRAALIGLGGTAVLGALAAVAGGMRQITFPGSKGQQGSSRFEPPKSAQWEIMSDWREIGPGVYRTSGGQYVEWDPSKGQMVGVSATQAQRDIRQRRNESHPSGSRGDNHPGSSGGYPHPEYHARPGSTFTLPQNLANQLAKAQAGYGNLDKVEKEIRDYILGLLKHHKLQGKGIEEAYAELAAVQNKAVADSHKAQTKFDQVVHNDTLLAQARTDLAEGEYAAAQQLLKQDQTRLQLLLSEAKTAEERTAVLRQLAEVERMRHSKADQFQLSPELQAQIAKADALAVLNPQAELATQLQLAREAKAQALKAIHSHTLTMQGLIQAWQIVAQENQVIAGALGMANTYHAVSTAALTRGLGLSHDQDLKLRERLAQREAHRGEAPDAPRTGFGDQRVHHHHGSHHHHPTAGTGSAGTPQVHIDVKLVGDLKKIISEVQAYERRTSQRAGGRR